MLMTPKAEILAFLKERTAQRQCTVDELIRELEPEVGELAVVPPKKSFTKKRHARADAKKKGKR